MGPGVGACCLKHVCRHPKGHIPDMVVAQDTCANHGHRIGFLMRTGISFQGSAF